MKQFLSWAAVAVALTGALAGCGSSSDKKSSGASLDTSVGAAGPSDAQIEERSGPDLKFAPPGDKLLPRSKLLVKSAAGVDLTHQSVTLPLHKGSYKGKRVWFVITESSDAGLAADLNVNHSSKLANMAVNCPKCVQQVNLTGSHLNVFGEGTVQFQGVPDFSPTRKLKPGPSIGPAAFPPESASPGSVGDSRYSPFIRIKGSSVVYNAPIVAVGDKPSDVTHHTDTADRVLKVTIPPKAKPGRFSSPTVEMLLVHGNEAGGDIFYLSTEASDKVAATLERATFVPLLQGSSFQGGDDFLGAARERIFLFANGQTGAKNPQAQGLSHLIKDGHSTEDASLANTALLKSLAENDGDALNVLGDFPSLSDPRHAEAYSPLWDAQVGEWTKKAIRLKLDKRQSDENEILNLAAKRPDLLTGLLGTPYGSAGFVINCPTMGFLGKPPVIDQAKPVPGGQF